MKSYLIHSWSIRAFTLLMPLLLSGCGLTHSVAHSTASMAHALFYRSVDTLHLQFEPRAGFNQDDDKVTLPVTLRVYQLTERAAFDAADYQTLLKQPDQILKASKLAETTVRIIPDKTVTIAMPMDAKTRFVAIVGLFRTPDRVSNPWRLVIPRAALDPDDPRIIAVKDSSLILQALKE